MKNLIKKISLSLLTLLLVFTSVSSYEFTKPEAQVQAEEFSLETMRSKLIAIIMAAIGITITSDVTQQDLNNVYNNLSTTAKYVLNNFDYQNRFYANYYALTLAELKEVVSSLANTFKADSLTNVPVKYYSNGIYYSPLLNFSTFFSTRTPVTTTNRYDSYTDDYIFNIYGKNPTIKTEHYKISIPTNVGLYGLTFNNLKSFVSNFTYAPLSKFTSSVKSDYFTGQTINLSDLVLAIYAVHDATNIANPFYALPRSGSNSLYIKYDTLAQYDTSELGMLVSLYGSSLTLPAPLGGWDNSQAGDIDVPNDWTKRITNAAGLPLVVLGGLTINELLNLKNKGPQDVLVGGDLPANVEDTLTGTGSTTIPDTGVDVLNPTFPDINIGEALADLAGWLGGALGELSGAIAGTIANAANALIGLGNSIWKSIKDILAILGGLVGALTLAMTNTADYILTGLEALLATLAASLLLPFQGFSWSDLTANWDWLKTLLNFIKDFIIALWELIKFFLSLFQYLFNWFITLLNLLYQSFFVGLASTLILLSSRVKSLLTVLPNPLDTIAGLTYDVAVFGLVFAIIRNVLFLLRGKK